MDVRTEIPGLGRAVWAVPGFSAAAGGLVREPSAGVVRSGRLDIRCRVGVGADLQHLESNPLFADGTTGIRAGRQA